MLNELIHVFFLEELSYCNEETYWIDQSLYSIPLILKKMFYCNPPVLSVISFFQFFQSLDCEKQYRCLSHPATLYFLKELDRHKIVKITRIIPQSKYNLKDHYNEFGYHVQDKISPCYQITFVKLRSFQKQDQSLLISFLKILKLDLNLFQISSKHMNLQMTVKKNFFVSNLLSGKIQKEIRDKESYEKELIHDYVKENIIRLKCFVKKR